MRRSRSWAADVMDGLVTPVFWAAAAVAAFAVGFLIFQKFNGTWHVRVVGVVHLSDSQQLPRGLDDYSGQVRAMVQLDQPPALLYVLHVWGLAAVWVVGLLGLWEFRGLVRSVRKGQAFSDTNVRRLRILGLVLLVYEPLSQTINEFVSEGFLATVKPRVPLNVEFHPFSIVLVISALSVLALAQVFAEGLHMRSDLEGTV